MTMPPVDVIVPVHGAAAATRRCLDSVLAAEQKTAFELVIVDDASTDADLVAYLRGLAGAGRATLVEQPARAGFAAAVNRGLALHTDRDAIILHSDAVVANDWLDRLAYHAQRQPGTGIVVPFSSSGGPAGYPRLEAANALPDAEDVARFDGAFARANPRQSVALTIVSGPCLYLRRECAASVGAFDGAPLGSDRGIDVDYCLRAGGVGFRHFLAGDVFVGHEGHASFGPEDENLTARSEAALATLYPGYRARRTAQLALAAGRAFARRADMQRLAQWPLPRIVFVAHGWGGGIRRHMNDLAGLLRGHCEVLSLEPAADDMVKLHWPRVGEEFAAYFTLPRDLRALAGALRALGVVRLHYHHIHLLPQAILDLPAATKLPYDCTLHDYYPICPQYHLVTADGRYCGEPAAAGCSACIVQRPHRWNLDITAWRATFESFLAAADRVIAPSLDVAKRIGRYFPARAVDVWPHPETALPPPPPVARVVVLGNLSPEKGLRVVAACARDAKLRGLALTFRILGSTTEPVPQSPDVPLSIFGQYEDAQLAQLLAAERPDVIWFPAQVPETYSYTFSVALASGVPLVASSLGALSERLSNHPQATAVRWNALPAEWNAALIKAAGVDVPSATTVATAFPAAVAP